MSLVVEMRGIEVRFGSVVALDAVNIEVSPGTIHAIVGENGAGKTTLMRVLQGMQRPNAGEIKVRGSQMQFRSARDGIAQRIGMVSQHYSIIPELTALQNLILGAEPGVFMDLDQARTKAQALAEKMGFEFDWNRTASGLSPASSQKLEILKLLWRGAEIMILDEPTAMLSPADADALFASLKQLVREGATVLLVTHRLPEVLEFSDHVTVLRGGKLIESKPVSQTNPKELAELIIGHAVSAPPEKRPISPDPMLRVEEASVTGYRGDRAVKGVSFEVRRGEILGIAGVDGSGQRELIHALMGVTPLNDGAIKFEGQSLDKWTTIERIGQGFRIIPEDRHYEGVVEDWSLILNGALGLERLPPLAKGQMVDAPARRELAAAVAERFATKHGGLHQPMASLSGGNQQRFVAARALSLDPKVVLAFQPTRGLDIEGTASVYRAIREACEKGACAVVVSFDLDELIEHCDRIVAMNNGRIFEPKQEEAMDRVAIGRLMVGE